MRNLSVKFFFSTKKVLCALTVLAVVISGCGGDDDDAEPQVPEVEEVTITDIGGNVYKTVTIGTQDWMAENLKTTQYSDGTDIPNVEDNTDWINLNTGAYAWFNNDYATYGAVYGALYNWYAIKTGKLCPAGWHVPTDEEWKTLTDFLGGASVAGDKLKELGLVGWGNPFSGATNETGFTALPGGFRVDTEGKFWGVENYGYWWSYTEDGDDHAWIRYMDYANKNVFRGLANKKAGFCVRCLKD